MYKIWDLEGNKFIEFKNGCLNIKRNISNNDNESVYISSHSIKIPNKDKLEEVLSKIAKLWNKTDKNIVYDSEKILIEQDNSNIKISIFLDENNKTYYMKFRVIKKDPTGNKSIDYIKLNRQLSRDLYAIIRDNYCL